MPVSERRAGIISTSDWFAWDGATVIGDGGVRPDVSCGVIRASHAGSYRCVADCEHGALGNRIPCADDSYRLALQSLRGSREAVMRLIREGSSMSDAGFVDQPCTPVANLKF